MPTFLLNQWPAIPRNELVARRRSKRTQVGPLHQWQRSLRHMNGRLRASFEIHSTLIFIFEVDPAPFLYLSVDQLSLDES